MLRFSPYAWAKLLFLRDAGPTEVGGFGITEQDDLLCVNDMVIVEQHCTEITVEFADTSVADFFEDQVELGRRPEQFARIWIHTHPGDSPQPSPVDVKTFERVFGNCDWAVMFIIAQGGRAYADLYWRHGGPAHLRMQIELDFKYPFPAADRQAWSEEYDSCVREQSSQSLLSNREGRDWFCDNRNNTSHIQNSTPLFDFREAD
ncbi:hypothetical protein [uncultured Rubinisphaera sp.]|uniref:hypothetical protein n=1 Tax=uncultured Rubinisphaera sp. TaxID=1678686 RepID=UPI0030D814F5